MNPTQAAPRRALTRADILPLDEYVKVRRERRTKPTRSISATSKIGFCRIAANIRLRY